jgi:ketosteroid isomerase-like protein
MSQENVEIVRRALDAWNRRDIDALVAAADPGIEYVNAPTAVEPGTRRGIAEVTAVWRAQWETLDGRVEVDRFFDHGDEIIALGRLSGEIPGSDTRIEDRVLGSWTVRTGRIIRFEALGFGGTEVQAALEAAGLRE